MSDLPPGQRITAWEPFGLPRFARVSPELPERPVLWIGGAVRHPTQLDIAGLTRLGRSETAADLHCVTTWSATGMEWSGVPFRAVHEWCRSRLRPHPEAEWVSFVGADGYRCCMWLSDALAPDVLLADREGGVPLSTEGGAPLRLVVPGHYGYTWVRGVRDIQYRVRYDSGSAGWKGHRRGRVMKEERSALLPGWMWRFVWRGGLPWARRKYRDARGRIGPAQG